MRGKFKIKNYTSTTPVGRSIADIEELLAQAGATTVVKQYGDNGHGVNVVTGFTFTIDDNGHTAMFRLPANTAEYAAAMLSEKKRPRTGTAGKVSEQAERTAWRVLKVWVEIQLTLIRVHRIHPFQVFMGYLYDPRKNETFFQIAQREGFARLLTAGNSSK